MIPTNGADYEGWFSSNGVYSIPRYTNSADLIRNGATNLPANYLTHTPNRYLDCLNDGYGRVVTSKIYHVGPSTVITSLNWCGDSVVLTNTWTNGAFLEVKCTNVNIQQAGPEYEAYTDEILGWCGMTNILKQLRYTTSAFCGNDGVTASDIALVEAGYGDTAFCAGESEIETGISATWAAQSPLGCDGTTNTPAPGYNFTSTCDPFSFGFSKYYEQGYQSIGGTSQIWYGYARNDCGDLTVAVGSASTGITYHADLYVACQTNFTAYFGLFYTNIVLEYDDYSQGFTTNLTVFGSIDATGPATNTIRLIDDPQNPALPTAPQSPVVTNTSYIRGFSGARAYWVVDWTVSGGFKYK
jgi:hypothetical protein